MKHVDHKENVEFRCLVCTNYQKFIPWEKFDANGHSDRNQVKHVCCKHGAELRAVVAAIERQTAGTNLAHVTEEEIALLKDDVAASQLIQVALTQHCLAETEPFTYIESATFQRIINLALRFINPAIHIPKAKTIESDVVCQVKAFMDKLRVRLTEQASKLHICLDGWISANKYLFFGVTVYFIDNKWKLQEELLLFKECTEHAGKNLAEIVKQTLDDFSILVKLGCETMNNACANLTMMDELGIIFEGNSDNL